MTDSAAPATFRAVLHNREFRALFSASGLSVVGDQISRLAIALLVFERTGSALASAATYATSFLTWLVGGPVLSALADRLPRRRIMIFSDSARMVLIALLAVGGLPLWAVFAVLVLVGLLAPPFDAARSALLADLLTGEAYLRANTLNVSLNQAGQVLGFVVGGTLVAAIGTSGALLVDATTFAASAMLLLLVVRDPAVHERTGPRRSLLRDTAEGVRYVAGTPRLRFLLSWALIGAGLLIVPEGLAVPVAAGLDGGSVAAGVLTATVPAGFVLGSLLLNRSAAPRREALFAPLALLSAGTLLLTPLLPQLWMVAVLWTLAGTGNALQLIANTTYVQAVSPELRGRAFGVAATGLMAAQGLALLASGGIAELLGAASAVAVLAGVGVLAVAVTVRFGRSGAVETSDIDSTRRSAS